MPEEARENKLRGRQLARSPLRLFPTLLVPFWPYVVIGMVCQEGKD